MAKKLSAKEKARRANARAQQRRNTKYERMLSQARNVFHDSNLGQYGISFDKYLKYAGVGVGLKKPTEETLKKLKKIQSKEDALKLAQRLVLLKKFSEKQQSELEEIKRRIKAEKSLKDAEKRFKSIDKISSPDLKAIAKIRYFLQQLDEYIQGVSSGGLDDKSKKRNEIVRNAKKIRDKLKAKADDLTRRVNMYRDDDDHFGDYSDAITALVTLGYNIDAFISDYGTFERTMFYDDTVGDVDYYLFEKVDIFI